MEIKLQSKTLLRGSILSLQFSRPAGLVFEAGDYVELSMGQHGKRWLSIASSPSEPFLRFIVKINKNSDFKKALALLPIGGSAHVSPALGTFNLTATPKSLLFVAGGIGITPFLSLLEYHYEKNLTHLITVLYAAKPGEHIELETLSRYNASVAYLERRPRLDDLVTFTPNLKGHTVYLAGPEPLCIELEQELAGFGLPKKQRKLSYFEGYEEL